MANFIEDVINSDLATSKYTEIVTRFPPEPNGYLHIGHAKAICLNYGLAVKYRGVCHLRFDDTNPTKEDGGYINPIIEDMKWLGWRGQIYYASDYFEQMFDAAVRLIKGGKAYVDETDAEGIKAMRGDLTHAGIESKARGRTVEQNLQIFNDMRAGKYDNGAFVLRAKIDMSSPNINMRDPVLYRVLKNPHQRTGDKWVVYPMYDFAHPIEDAIEGITHSCCTLEFEDHRPLYDWVLSECGGFDATPHQYEFARLNIGGMLMSKRYLKKIVDDGSVDGWDDPRMPTIAALRRRGYTPTAIRDFCERIGVSKSNSTVDIAMLESCIREELNLVATRVMAVVDPIELVINNRDDSWSENLDFDTIIEGETKQKRDIKINNKLFIDRADFEIAPPPKYKRLTVGNMVRLKAAYIVKCTKYDVDDSGNVIRVYVDIVDGTRSGNDNSGIKASGVIHWVCADNCKDITIHQFGQLVDEQGEFNKDSLIVHKGKLEKGAFALESPFQFVRHGYYCIDTKNKKTVNNVFNEIVGLKDSFKRASAQASK